MKIKGQICRKKRHVEKWNLSWSRIKFVNSLSSNYTKRDSLMIRG